MREGELRVTIIDLFDINLIQFFFAFFRFTNFFLFYFCCHIFFVPFAKSCLSVPFTFTYHFRGFAHIWFLYWIYANHRTGTTKTYELEMPTVRNGNHKMINWHRWVCCLVRSPPPTTKCVPLFNGAYFVQETEENR